jgi:hypothetical protein
MARNAEMLHGLAGRVADCDGEFSRQPPLSAHKAFAIWMALSALGWACIAAIGAIVTLTLF